MVIRMEAIDIVRKIRIEKKHTQADIAGVLGIKQSTYSDIENKRIQLKADDFLKICRFLNIDFKMFFDNVQFQTIVLTNEEKDQIRNTIEILSQRLK